MVTVSFLRYHWTNVQMLNMSVVDTQEVTVIILETFLMFSKEYFIPIRIYFKSKDFFPLKWLSVISLEIGWYPLKAYFKVYKSTIPKGPYLFISENHLPHCCILSDVQIKGSQWLLYFQTTTKGTVEFWLLGIFLWKFSKTMCGWNLAFIFASTLEIYTVL